MWEGERAAGRGGRGGREKHRSESGVVSHGEVAMERRPFGIVGPQVERETSIVGINKSRQLSRVSRVAFGQRAINCAGK